MEQKTKRNLPGRVGTPKERFWKKVHKTDYCWEWQACLNSNGYGVFFFNGKNVAAHRFSYFLVNPEADHSLNVLHKCDNPRCVRPEHLFLGTFKDNSLDMVAKNRHPYPKGDENSLTKYSNEVKRLIVEKKLSPYSAKEFFGMSRSTYFRIKKEYGYGVGQRN